MTAAIAVDKMIAALESIGDDTAGSLGSLLSGAFEKIGWAEDEIRAAQRRHPHARDLLFHSFALLCQTHELMSKERVFRSHCRELLDRVAAGGDTRPGTTAEVIVSLSEASHLAPLTGTATGLYGRLWGQAFPGLANPWDEIGEHYEALRGPAISDLDAEARRKLADPDRRITEIDCMGKHHGEPVNCTAQVPGTRHAVPAAA